VAAGAYINGKAGELAQKKTNSVSMTAGDTVSCIADIISEIGQK
jgi:NAD(P)H-hydrate repair Nnr-like enzyme with NAD(P)H-hydrate dehydratase domain